MVNSAKIMKELPTIVATETGHILMCPNGTIVPCIVWTRVYDEAGKLPYVIMKVDCNIAMSANEFKEDTPEVVALKDELKEKKDLIRHLRSEIEQSKDLKIKIDKSWPIKLRGDI